MVKELSHIFCLSAPDQTDNDNKYDRKSLGRRYGTIPLPFKSRHKKNNKESWKNRIKINKQCSIVFNKTGLGRVIPKTLKMVLDTSLLNTQQYKVRIKGKVEQSRKRSSAFPYISV